KPPNRARHWRRTGRTWSSMAACTCLATTISRKRKPLKWKPLNAIYWLNWATRTPMPTNTDRSRAAAPAATGYNFTIAADAAFSHCVARTRLLTRGPEESAMSEDRSSNEKSSWFNKLTQAFADEPRNRQEMLAVLRDAH